MMGDKNIEGEATYQQALSQTRLHQKFRSATSSLFSSGTSMVWALLFRSATVYGTLAAVTDTTTVEERQSVAMSKERIIFLSFDLVWCFWYKIDRRRTRDE
jgi:hypothetical protein